MVDQFVFELDSGRVQYPSLEKIKKDKCFKEGFEQWGLLERHRKLGINDKIFVDILKTGEFKEENLEFYQIFAESFGTLILIKEEHIWSLDDIGKQDLEDRYNFSF
jgi:hypothetical protein